MKNFKLIFNIFIIILIQLKISKESSQEEKIAEYRKNFSEINATVLTDDNYIDILQSHPFTLMYFHAYDDRNSIDFMPTFKFINDYLKTSEPYNQSLYLINVGSIEISDENNTNIQARFRFASFPFFILFSSVYQKYIQYTGYMNAQSIITFCMKAVLDNIIQINNEKRLNQLLNPQLTHLSLFSMRATFNFDYFYRASQNFKFALFADCIGKKVCKNYFNKPEYKNSDIILAKMNLCKNDFICGDIEIMDKKLKPSFILYNITSYEEFIEFISLNIIPPIHNMTDFNYELMSKNNLKTLIYIRGKNEKKSNQKISLILQKIIKNKKNGIRWGSILDPINSLNDYEIRRSLRLEIEDYEKKGLILIHTMNKIKNETEIFRMNMKGVKELDQENIMKFVDEYNSGKIKRDLKSELKPTYHPKHNLRMVVGKTFEEEILNNFNKSIVLILLNLHVENLYMIEHQIESISLKFDLYNETIIFNFLDSELNEMPDMPEYDKFKGPFFRYYYKNKTKGFVDFVEFKGKNIFEESEIVDWIIDNYAKEYGIEKKYGMRMHIEGMSEILSDKDVMKEMERKQEIEQMKENLGVKDNINDRTKDKKEESDKENKNKNKETDL